MNILAREANTLGINAIGRQYRSFLPSVLAILGLIAYFSAINPLFLSVANAGNIGRQSAVLLMVALAETVVVLVGSIDLSIGALVTVAGLITALSVDRFGVLGAVVTGVAFGCMVGLANGILVTSLRVPSFLVTLGMLSILSGVGNLVSQGESVLFDNQFLPRIVNGTALLGTPDIIWFTILLTMIFTVVVFRTRLGRYLYALGGGELVAANAGVPVTLYKILAFVICGGTCGLAGVVLTGQVAAGTPSAGSGLLLNAIAAVVMGGTALSGGVGGPHRTFLGVLVIAVLTNGMDVTQVDPFVQDIVKGIVIILAVALSIDRSKYALIK
jgi:ribose transport system permease protein